MELSDSPCNEKSYVQDAVVFAWGFCAAFSKRLKTTLKTKSDRGRLDWNIQIFLTFCLKKKRCFIILGQIIFLTVFILALKMGHAVQRG